ncbi:MAG: antibiotic biosynthesis monooxygenase [Candidatus Thiodiazotropha sp.]|jgi:heme-degrading monooxygenase HmoA
MTTTPTPTPPDAPYYAVIFSSRRTPVDAGYAEVAQEILELARQQPGFLGFESARDATGQGISISYWASPEAIAAWKEHVTHRRAQARARDWYKVFHVRVCRVEREYGFDSVLAPDS